MTTKDCPLQTGYFMSESESPIFIVGMQRSGTTLMRAILSSHPHIAIAPETHYCNRFMKQVNGHSALDIPTFKSFWRTFSESERFRDLGINPAVLEKLVYASGDLSLGNTFSLVLREYARQQGRPRWGEKTPHHYRYIQQLLSWFPNARILVMVRDPRAVCSSLLVVPWRQWGWRGVGSLELHSLKRARRICLDAAQWQQHVDDLRLRWAEDVRIKIVTYESLVHDPNLVIRAVCEFVEVPFVESMLTDRSWSTVTVRDYKSYSNNTDTWIRNHLASSIAPISSAAVDKWRESLLIWEIECIEKTCASGMRWIGYRRAYEMISVVDQLRGQACRLWSRTYRKLFPDADDIENRKVI